MTGGLYPAKSNPDPNKLQMINPCEGSSAREGRQTLRRRRIKTFTSYNQGLDSNDQPLHTLLRRFGNIVPQRARFTTLGQSTPSLSQSARRDEHLIEPSLLCFRTLHKVASIDIEWVDCLSEHLEFNSSTRKLKLFRLPSLCLIMSACEHSPFSG